MKYKCLFFVLVLCSGCSSPQRANSEPQFDELYLKEDITGVYSTPSGFNGCSISIQLITLNEYVVTSQEWGDMGSFPRFTEKAKLISGILYFDECLIIASLEGKEKVDELRIYKIDGKPIISTDEYVHINFKLKFEGDFFYRREDFPSPPTFETSDPPKADAQ